MDRDSLLASLVPRIETARLVLREPRLSDFEGFAANAADPAAQGPNYAPVGRRDAWRMFHGFVGHWVLQGLGTWIVEAKGRGPVGTVGVFRRESTPDIEIGWVVYRPHWKQGYASEAARAALDCASGPLGIERVVAYVGTSNVASSRVATRIGMRGPVEADLYGQPALKYVFERGG